MTDSTRDDALWQRVNAALDARVDPFDDLEPGSLLAASPRARARVQRLLARLELLRASPARPRRTSRSFAVAAAALLLAGGALFTGLGTGSSLRAPSAGPRAAEITLAVARPTPPPARGARVVLAPRRVFTWTLEGDRP